MKIVINACFGGFSVSREALSALAATDCPHVKRNDPEQYYNGTGRNPDWRRDFEKDMAREPGGVFGRPLLIDGKIVTDDHRPDKHRTCPRLVEVVERMRTAADGSYAQLRIVEVPDGVDFEVAEYDGSEHIAEAHRTWR